MQSQNLYMENIKFIKTHYKYLTPIYKVYTIIYTYKKGYEVE